MKTAIVGAGLGGLACAIACRREDLAVVVLERSPDGCEIGAGIQIPPNGARILKELGLLHKLLEAGSVVQHVDFRRYDDGHLLRSMPFGDDIVEEFGVPWIIIHRQDLHRVLLDEATRLGAEVRLNAEVTDVVFEGPEVLLAGGERVAGDVIIGADGLYSRVRDLVLGSPTVPQETGDLAYRATFKKEQLEALNDPKVEELCRKSAVTSWLGPGKHSIFYPVRGGEEFNLVLLRPDNLEKGARRVEGDVAEMRESYAGWDETLRKLISCVPSVNKWKLAHLPELPTWTKGTVALLGDACHPTLPYQAQGAAMAVEDGFAVGKLLGLLNEKNSRSDPAMPSQEATRQDIAAVLGIYEQVRKGRTARSVRAAIANRWIFHIPDGILQRLRDFVLGSAGMTRKSDWTWLFSWRMKQTLYHDLPADCQRAFEAYSPRPAENRPG
ncbi:putative salicylate hydroxylase [Aspergillus lucknowensis]|uniref:FAD-binding domain-containing protein n=1 Tax=Aspergillus lucknowensis TaxID=176173 RepID=A0ABR4M3K5_9EURO